jgi:hypothetical protein
MARGKFGGKLVGIAAGGSILGLMLAGCGMPGPPQPPSLQLAKPVGDLEAARTGPTVRLRWSGPVENTDKTKVKAAGKTEICRKESDAGSCTRVGEAANKPGGELSYEDVLPERLRTGAPRALEYEVSVENVHGRSAGWSDPVLTAAGQAPGDVIELTATTTWRGVWLRWREASPAEGTAVTWRIERRLVEAPAAAARPKSAAGQKSAAEGQGLGAPEKEIPERTLEVEGTDAASGEALDSHITWNAKYAYRVQAVRKVKVETARGPRGVEILGRRSGEVEVSTKDVFPPAAPQGLAGVPGWDEAGAQKGPRVDLSWSPNREGDMAGYRVFRTENGGPEQLVSGAQPVVASSFADHDVKAGTKYRYWVVAVDESGNASAASEAIEVETLASGN